MAAAKSHEDYVSQVKEALLSTGDTEKYDITGIEYVNAKTKVKVICREHGEWMISPNHLLNGRRCPSCKRELLSNLFRENNESLRRKLEEDFAGKASFINLEEDYVNNSSKLRMMCNTHGEFESTWIRLHSKKQGCPKCFQESKKPAWNKKSLEEYFKDHPDISSGRYSISSFVYKGAQEKGEMICSNHGPFKVSPEGFCRYGSRCPRCSTHISELEREVREFVLSLNLVIEYNVPILDKKHIDIYIPSLKIGIEVCGVFFHGELRKSSKTYHVDKFLLAQEKGIHLIQIFEDEWVHRKDQVKKTLINKLLANPVKVFGRKTLVNTISFKEANFLYKEIHLQGSLGVATHSFGIFLEGNLVSAMSFFKEKDSTSAELVRFASSIRIVGGFSKLFNLAKKELSSEGVNEVYSFSDNRWSEGRVYSRNGFKLDPGFKDIPRFWWVKGNMRFHRRGFQRKYLPSKLKEFDPSLSEAENCRKNGFFKIWDAGVRKWKFSIE